MVKRDGLFTPLMQSFESRDVYVDIHSVHLKHT